jgi:putative PIN family toxin of toxin-antitoxin system
MTRVLLDTNVYLSYLLAADTARIIAHTVERCLHPDVQLWLPHELMDELAQAVVRKAYFRLRVTDTQVTQLLTLLMRVATVPERLEDQISLRTRDSRDDYLLAYAVMYDIDFLVTGDKDLLTIGRFRQLHIVTPAEFLVAMTG